MGCPLISLSSIFVYYIQKRGLFSEMRKVIQKVLRVLKLKDNSKVYQESSKKIYLPKYRFLIKWSIKMVYRKTPKFWLGYKKTPLLSTSNASRRGGVSRIILFFSIVSSITIQKMFHKLRVLFRGKTQKFTKMNGKFIECCSKRK